MAGGERDKASVPRVTELRSWPETSQDAVPGDIIGVDRGNGLFRVPSPFHRFSAGGAMMVVSQHMGVVCDVSEEGVVTVHHLSGTAQDVLKTHGLKALKEVKGAMTDGQKSLLPPAHSELVNIFWTFRRSWGDRGCAAVHPGGLLRLGPLPY